MPLYAAAAARSLTIHHNHLFLQRAKQGSQAVATRNPQKSVKIMTNEIYTRRKAMSD